MKTVFSLALFLLAGQMLCGQNDDCRAILRVAQKQYDEKRLEKAQETLRDLEDCDYKELLRAERQTLQKKIFDAIQKQKEDAEASETEKTKAEHELQKTLDSLKSVLTNLEKANSDIVNLNLGMAESLAAEEKYDEAVNRIETAATLNPNSKAVQQSTEKLCLRLLTQARRDLDSMQYRKAAASIRLAERLKTSPDSIRAAYRALQHFLFENAHRDIERPRYTAAADKMDLAEAMGFPTDTIAAVYFELAFCLNEIGQVKLAGDMIQRLARLLHKPGALKAIEDKSTSNHSYLLQTLDPRRFEWLRERYFSQAFRNISGGTLQMGEALQGGEKAGGCPVGVAPFEMAAKEVTFYEFYLFCKATRQTAAIASGLDPSKSNTGMETFPSGNDWGGGTRPVIDVTWLDAIEYCNWRSRIEGREEVYTWERKEVLPYEEYLKKDLEGWIFRKIATWEPPMKREYLSWLKDASLDEIIESYKDLGGEYPPPNALKSYRAQSPKPPTLPAKITCNWNADGYRLPTEAEWEFAAGNGLAHTHYAWGNEPPSAQAGGNVADAQLKSNFENWQVFSAYTDGYLVTAPVGSFPPNAFGLYDLSGNVWEWCWDWHHGDYCNSHDGRKEFYGPATGHERALRGGAWGSYPDDCRVRRRHSAPPDMKNFSTGFRLVRKGN